MKMVHYTTLYGGPSAQPLTAAQQAVYDYLDRIPRRPRPPKEPNPRIPL